MGPNVEREIVEGPSDLLRRILSLMKVTEVLVVRLWSFVKMFKFRQDLLGYNPVVSINSCRQETRTFKVRYIYSVGGSYDVAFFLPVL